MQKEQYIERAQEILATHEYTELANTEKLVAWRCQRPNSSCYGFDILITRYGIAIVGDIDNLSFRVGLDYGLNFLAGTDLDYCIHSKLDQHCKARELDESVVLEFCRDNWLRPLQEMITDWLEDDEESEQAKRAELLAALSRRNIKEPEQLEWLDDIEAVSKIKTVYELKEIFYATWCKADELSGYISKKRESFDLYEISEALGQIDETSSEEGFYSIVTNAPDGDCELGDWTFTEPAESLIQELHIINQAAKAILEQKSTSKESQTKEAAQ